MVDVNNSIETDIKFWFIPVDILMILCTGFAALIGLIFFLIIIVDKANRTISTILLCNSLLSEIIFASSMCSMAIFSLQNDMRRIEYEDSLCTFRAYLSYAISAVRSHSYVLQSIYHYMSIVHPSKFYYQSMRFQLYLISFTWLLSLIHPFPFLWTNQIKYSVDNQVCHMPFQPYLYILYTCFLAYLNPITIIVIIYFKLVRFVQKMNKLVTPVNQYIRIQRELVMVRRIVMLLVVLITVGLPYTIFFIMSFVTDPPKYHFRWAFLSVDISLAFVMIALYQFSDSIKTFVTELLNNRLNGSSSSI